MSRTLSRGRKATGPNFWLDLVAFLYGQPPGLTAESRVCPTPVLQFNIRPWRLSAGHSVATAGALVILRVSCRACRPCAGATEKEREWAPTASDAAAGGMTSSGWRCRALGGLHHAAERPAPARELPGDRAVGHRRWQVPVHLCALATVIAWGIFDSLAAQTAISRILFAMSRDGMMPKALAKVHPTYKTPYVAALFVGILSIIL